MNHEGITKEDIGKECLLVTQETGLPAFDPLEFGADKLMELILEKIEK